MRALVSVRSVDEALLAADAGVTLIDGKEPRDGALGALPHDVLARIAVALRGRAVELSATIGDAPHDVAAAVHDAAAWGIDVVKVGVASISTLRALERLPQRVVPVLLVDGGLDDTLLDAALERFATLMLDTVDKRRGLFDHVPVPRLQGVLARAHAAGRHIGLAGALRLADVPRLHDLAPDFAGFRSAVCDGDRGGAMSAARLRALLAALSADAALRAVA
jgi:uncharacterized protein (UPF0264 family)